MLKRIITLALAAILALSVFATAALAENAEETTYYVYTDNGKDLNVRSEPNGDIIGELPWGEKVEVISFVNENWAMIKYKDEDAYVARRYLIEIDPNKLVRLFEEEEAAFTGDPLADLDAEFASAVKVDEFKVSLRPARVTALVNMRWIPNETGRIIAQYRANDELIVLKELKYYLQVRDPDTGDVGYIHKKFAVR